MSGTGTLIRVMLCGLLLAIGLGGMSIGLGGCRKDASPPLTGAKKVVIIGADGMDPIRAERLMVQGRLPNLARLRDEGGFRRLTTSIPPQSAVA